MNTFSQLPRNESRSKSPNWDVSPVAIERHRDVAEGINNVLWVISNTFMREMSSLERPAVVESPENHIPTSQMQSIPEYPNPAEFFANQDDFDQLEDAA